MYRLQVRSGVKPDTWKDSSGSGSISSLKDLCTVCRMDYRIIDGRGKVVWADLWPKKGRK